MDENTFGRAFDYIKEVIERSRNFEGETEIELDEGNFTARLDESIFKKFEGAERARGAAIDGSSFRILSGHSFVIAGRRTGYVIADEKGIISRKIGDITIEAIEKREAKRLFEEKYEEFMGCMPDDAPDSIDEVVDAVRGLEENAAARDAMDRLEAGDILMMDGSLRGGKFLSEVIDRNCKYAADRGIHLVGVCKRSDLYTDRLPVLSWVKVRGDRIFGRQRWYYPLSEGDGIYIAKLHPFSRFSFRVDMNPAERDVDGIFSMISAFSNDVSYMGYPYPLAEIHRNVVITSEDGLYCRKALREMALMNGFTMDDWEELFLDYHDYLG